MFAIATDKELLLCISNTGEANLITSYIGGSYTTDRTTNKANVYESYIAQQVPYVAPAPSIVSSTPAKLE